MNQFTLFFEDLRGIDLPSDIGEPLEQLKLAIVRHQARKWQDIDQSKLATILRSLLNFANHDMSLYISEWITSKYGAMWFTFANVGGTEVHVATVAVMNGVAIGMGETRDHAIYDLYEDLRSGEISTPLEGYWRARRKKLKPTSTRPAASNLNGITRTEAIGGDA